MKRAFLGPALAVSLACVAGPQSSQKPGAPVVVQRLKSGWAVYRLPAARLRLEAPKAPVPPNTIEEVSPLGPKEWNYTWTLNGVIYTLTASNPDLPVPIPLESVAMGFGDGIREVAKGKPTVQQTSLKVSGLPALEVHIRFVHREAGIPIVARAVIFEQVGWLWMLTVHHPHQETPSARADYQRIVRSLRVLPPTKR